MTIERSIGTVVHGFIVGGGYEGNTTELDKTVMEAANILQSLYSKDIEIRFNSDRRSGGAWLKNSLKGFDAHAQIGICAGYEKIRPRNMTVDEWIHTDIDKLPEQFLIATYIKATALLNPALANNGNENSRYSYCYHKTLAEATEYLIKNVNVERIEQ